MGRSEISIWWFMMTRILTDMTEDDSDCPVWPTYTNNEFGWSMQYPCDWTNEEYYELNGDDPFTEYPQRYTTFIDPSGDYGLVVGIKPTSAEGGTISRTGVGAGEFQDQVAMEVLNTQIPVRYLVYNEALDVFYYSGGSVNMIGIDGDEYQFTASFGQYSDDLVYDDIDLIGSGEVSSANQIIESLQLPYYLPYIFHSSRAPQDLPRRQGVPVDT